MLTEEQINVLEQALIPLFDNLEKEVIADVARRIQKTTTYTRTAELQAMSMRDLGYSPARISAEAMKMLRADKEYQKVIAENTLSYKQFIREKIKAIVQSAQVAGDTIVGNAGDMAWIDDMRIWESNGITLGNNSFLHTLVEAYNANTAGFLNNLTNTMAFKGMFGYAPIMNLYQTELNKAIVMITSGTFGTDEVIKKTVHNLAKSGLRSVDYANGRSMQIDSAVRLQMRTTFNQLSGEVSNMNIVDTEVNLIYVSEHQGSRNNGEGIENHAEWEGKVYYYGENHPKEYAEEAKRIGQNSITELYQATGYSVDGSQPNNLLGLHGYNCRHQHYPWFIGASTLPARIKPKEPIEYNGRTYDEYGVTQKMRQMERDVRALKREKDALQTLGEDTKEINARIKSKTKEYNEFCGVAGVNPEPARMRYESGTSDITKTKSWQDYQNMKEKSQNTDENE